jgi:DNA replication licensing factor MCM4
LLLDTPDQSRDTKLAKHLVSLYFAHRDVDQARTLPTELLSRYIAHARHNCDPELTDEASEGLIAGYVEMRKRGESNKTITATTRQLESLIRLSEALAKMRLSDYVLRSDVDEAIRLMKLATFNAATDPRTGLLDMDLITTGHGAAHAEMVRMLKQRIMDLVKQHTERYRDQPISTEQLFVLYVSLASEKDDVQREDFNEALLSLQEEDRISIAGRHIVPR